jgi:hypothetical protein
MSNLSIKAPTEPFLQGVAEANAQIPWHHYLTKTLFIAMAVSGLWSLFRSTEALFFVYPRLPDYFRQQQFAEVSYEQLINSAMLISITSFFESSFGLAFLFKKRGTVKNLHIAVAILLLLFSTYLKFNGDLLDARSILESTQLVNLP